MKKIIDISEEGAIFRAAVGKVRPVVTNTVVLKAEQKPRPIPVVKPLERVDPFRNEIDGSFETVYPEDSVQFIAPGVQKNTLKKLRKGHFKLDADIDLHGLTSREAMQHLLIFLHHCLEDGYRCVQIVHGKGYHSPGKQPVLKN